MKDNFSVIGVLGGLFALGILAGIYIMTLVAIPSSTSITNPAMCQKAEGKPQWKQEIKIDKSETYTYWGCWIELKN